MDIIFYKCKELYLLIILCYYLAIYCFTFLGTRFSSFNFFPKEEEFLGGKTQFYKKP